MITYPGARRVDTTVERRIPLDCRLLRRVVAALLAFWVALAAAAWWWWATT